MALFDLSEPFMADGSLRRRRLDSFVANHPQFLVAEERHHLVGCVGVERIADDGGERWVLYNLCVHSARQGRGIGALLLDAAVDLVSGPSATALFAASLSSNPWFAQHGFMMVDPATAPARWVEQLDPARESIVYERVLSGVSAEVGIRLAVTSQRLEVAS